MELTNAQIHEWLATGDGSSVLEQLDADTRALADDHVREALRHLRTAAVQYTLAGEENLAQGARLGIGQSEDLLERTV